MNLELIAMRWLRYEKRLPIVVRERSPRTWWCGQPDAFGVSRARYITEIEIKRSMSDFRADFNKRSRRFRHEHVDLFPRQFYYLAPEEICESIEKHLPEWAGLLVARDSYAICARPAPINKLSKRLTINEAVRLVHHMANHILSAEIALNNWRQRFVDGYEPCRYHGVVDYSI